MIEERRGKEGGKVVVVNVKCAICHGDPGCWWSATLQTHSNGVKSGCQICFRQRRLSKKSSLTILLFTRSAIYRISYIFLYDIIFSYYILHYQKTYIYIYTHNVTFRTKEITRISVCRCNRSVKLPEEASKPSPVHTNLSNQNYVHKNSSYRVYNSLASILCFKIT